MAQTVSRPAGGDQDQAEYTLRTTRGPIYDGAALGFRQYWYPALRSAELGSKPKAVKMLGDELVLLRAGGKVYALHDRCVHRGMVLSEGMCLSEGTITCPYHGWTYDVADGQLVAALTDGPDSAVVGKIGKRVRTYPVEERNAIIWVYMGEGAPPPIEEDVPEEILDTDAYISGVVVNTWKCNWRAAVENGHDASHAPMVHMNSLRWRTSFGSSPAWYGYVDNVLKDGLYLHRIPRTVGGPSVYPRVGLWPRHGWLRKWLAGRTKRQQAGVITNSFRLPSMIRNTYPGYAMVRWVVPIDEQSCRNFMWLTGKGNALDRLKWLAWYWLWHRWVFTILFTSQDQRIVERLDYLAPEQLFRPDSSIVGLRKYIEANVRMPNRPIPGSNGQDASVRSR
jgi:phenylpropionate dioxygenase-like ring-hydroxylating dioxygenase large terminal subunit